MDADPVTGTFVTETADNKGASCVKLRVNEPETSLPADAWTVYALPTFRLVLTTMHESEIQLLN